MPLSVMYTLVAWTSVSVLLGLLGPARSSFARLVLPLAGPLVPLLMSDVGWVWLSTTQLAVVALCGAGMRYVLGWSRIAVACATITIWCMVGIVAVYRWV
jgi:hypothetical protein